MDQHQPPVFIYLPMTGTFLSLMFMNNFLEGFSINVNQWIRIK